MNPLLIGPKNCEAAMGCPWRWLRDHASELGLEVVHIDRKVFIDAQAAREAILSRRVVVEEPADDLADLRARLGKRRVG